MAQPEWPRRVSGATLTLILAPFLALALLVSAPAASAAPRQVSLAQVFATLSITAQPSDYIVIVDTSASMVDQGRYQLVKSGLSRMAKALRPDDRVAVITFDTGPTVRRPLSSVGSKPDAIASSLPGTPNGQGTDIGSALNAALNLMQGTSLRSRVAVLLFTDGKIDTPPTSPYATASSPGWAGLHERAATLQKTHDIAPLAIALTSNTDAAVLKQVFANVTDVPATNLGNYLAQVSTTVMKASATRRIQPAISEPVTASLSGLTSAPSPEPVAVTISIHNADPLVPVQVTGLGLAADPARALVVSDAPASVDVAAGATTTVKVKVKATDTLQPGTKTTYRVTGSVTSPWQNVIVHDLGLTWNPTLATTKVSFTEPAATASSAPAAPVAAASGAPRWDMPLVGAIGLVVAGIIALLLAIRAVWRSTRPPLIGTVSILRDGEVIEESLLRGRKMSVTLSDPAVSIVLTSTKNSQKEPGVRLHVTTGKNHTNGTLFEAQEFAVDALTITYTTDRTRMLRLIGTE